MKITKFGHACLLVEANGVTVLTDPGMWNPLPEVKNLDAIVITHEHQDHCDIDQVKALLAKHPNAKVITHAAVGEKLKEQGIAYEVIEPGKSIDVKGVSVESFGTEHAAIYGASPCRNTGFLINGELFVPGDALHDVPSKTVRVLALPTGGPWMKLSEAVDYAKAIKAQIVFPIHDAMYTEMARAGLGSRIVGSFLEGMGMTFVDMAAGDSKEF